MGNVTPSPVVGVELDIEVGVMDLVGGLRLVFNPQSSSSSSSSNELGPSAFESEGTNYTEIYLPVHCR